MNEDTNDLKSKRTAARLARESEIMRSSKMIADTVSHKMNIGLSSFKEDFAEEIQKLIIELAVYRRSITNPKPLKLPEELTVEFSKITSALSKDVVAKLDDKQINSLIESINERTATLLSRTEDLYQKERVISLEKPIEVDGLKDLLKDLVASVPKKITGEVAIKYPKAGADKYINVRLTNGVGFIDFFGGGGGGGGLTDQQLRSAPLEVDPIAVDYDKEFTYTSTTDVIAYKLDGETVKTKTITYSDSNKSQVNSIVWS